MASRPSRLRPSFRAAAALAAAALLAGAAPGILGACGPFTDVANDVFCPLVLEVFRLGITTGTTPTTFAPGEPVTRLQAAALLSRSVDTVLKRISPRTTLAQFAFPTDAEAIALTTVGVSPIEVRFDGADLWVSSDDEGSVSRVRASDGRLLETWTGMVDAWPVLVAMNRVLVGRFNDPGFLYSIDPSLPAGVPSLVATNLGTNPTGLAFDGTRVWSANTGTGGLGGSISIVTPRDTLPWTVTTVTSGLNYPAGILYDGSNVWVTRTAFPNFGHLLRLDSSGGIVQDIPVGLNPSYLTFDGTNLWVPNWGSNSVTVVRASSGAVLATLTGQGLYGPSAAAFDGERVLVTNIYGKSVSLWKAADLSPAGYTLMPPGASPHNACSDGVHFWLAIWNQNTLARF